MGYKYDICTFIRATDPNPPQAFGDLTSVCDFKNSKDLARSFFGLSIAGLSCGHLLSDTGILKVSLREKSGWGLGFRS